MISAYVANYLHSKFDPETMNFLLWQNSFEYIFELSNVEDEHKSKFLLHMVNPSVLTKLQEKCAPSKPDELSYNELISILERTYSAFHGRKAIDYRYLFRNQLPNEPVSHYVNELMKLFSETSLPIRIAYYIKDRFIEGLQDEEVRTVLKSKGDISFVTAISIAKDMEFRTKNIQLRNHLPNKII